MVLGAMVLSGCGLQNVWDASVDQVDRWTPRVMVNGDVYLVSWQERTSARRTVVEVIRGEESHRIASADGSQIVVSGDGRIAAYSSLGLVNSSVEAGVLRHRLDDLGSEDRLTLAPHLGPTVPDDRPWPTLLINSDNSVLWLAMGEVRPDHRLEYVLVRHREKDGIEILSRFTEVSMMAMTPDRRTVVLSGATVDGAPRSLFFIDSVSGEVRERLAGAGVGSFAMTGNNEGFATVGKASRSAADSTADDVLDRQLAGGAVIRFRGDVTEDLRLSLDGQSPDQLIASPNGEVLGIVGWRGRGRESSSNLWLVRTNDLAERNLTPKARVAGDGASFAPGGRYLAYGADDRLYRYDVTNDSTRDVFGQRGDAVWGSPSRMAWVNEENLLSFANIGEAGERGRLSLWLSMPNSERFMAARPGSWR